MVEYICICLHIHARTRSSFPGNFQRNAIIVTFRLSWIDFAPLAFLLTHTHRPRAQRLASVCQCCGEGRAGRARGCAGPGQTCSRPGSLPGNTGTSGLRDCNLMFKIFISRAETRAAAQLCSLALTPPLQMLCSD